jgi:hypothetical protein
MAMGTTSPLRPAIFCPYVHRQIGRPLAQESDARCPVFAAGWLVAGASRYKTRGSSVFRRKRVRSSGAQEEPRP